MSWDWLIWPALGLGVAVSAYLKYKAWKTAQNPGLGTEAIDVEAFNATVKRNRDLERIHDRFDRN